MGVSVRWFDDAQSIVYYEFTGNWTWEEFYAALEKALEMERSTSQRVDVVLDVRVGMKMPSNTIMHVINIAKKQPDNLALSIFVTQQQLVRMFIETIQRLSPTARAYYRVSPSLDDALSMIQADRAKKTEE